MLLLTLITTSVLDEAFVLTPRDQFPALCVRFTNFKINRTDKYSGLCLTNSFSKEMDKQTSN